MRFKEMRIGVLIACVLMLVASGSATAAPQLESPDAGLSGGGLLLDGLDGLLEDLPETTPAPTKPAPGEDLGAKPEQPLVRIASGMSSAEKLIAGRGQPIETSRVQQQVISELDELIKQAEKQCSQCQNPQSGQGQSQKQASQRSQPKPSGEQKDSQANQGKPSQRSQQAGRQSTTRLDAAGAQAASTRSPDELMKEVWGRLPQRVREQMLESSSDEFLPEYREEIERYFRELAEKPE